MQFIARIIALSKCIYELGIWFNGPSNQILLGNDSDYFSPTNTEHALNPVIRNIWLTTDEWNYTKIGEY